MLNRSDKCGHTYLVPYIRMKAFTISRLIVVLLVGFSHIAFNVLRYRIAKS